MWGIVLGRYWIRNRGRTQGPFTLDRIQGLLKRGRFNRHYHVSEDKKNWYPATEFPELFEGVVSQRGGSADDEEVFQGGGSPFDDDFDAPPAQVERGGRGRRSQSPFDDDDDDDEEWEDDDEEWEDDDEVGDGLVGWIESNSRALLVVLVIALGALGYFVFFRESFAQDELDLQVLTDAKSDIDRASAGGIDAGAWSSLSDQLEQSLAPMIERLRDEASSLDQVKQELLFGARDDIPRIIRELPNGRTASKEHLEYRIRIIGEMIEKRQRFYDGPQYQPKKPTPPPVAAPDVEQMPNQQTGENPPTTTAPAAGNQAPGATAPQPNTQPANGAATGTTMTSPGQGVPPGTGMPAGNTAPQQAPPPSGVPGRPPSVFQQ